MRVAAALRVAAAFFAVVVLRANQHAEFTLDDAVVLVRVLHDALADLDVLVERLMAGVDHDAGEPFVDALLAKLEGIAVVEVDGDGDGGQADAGLDELLEVNGIGVLARALGNLQHHRSLFLLARFDDRLEQLHVVDVKRAERVFALERLGEQVFGMC